MAVFCVQALAATEALPKSGMGSATVQLKSSVAVSPSASLAVTVAVPELASHADRVILDVAGRFQTLRLPRSEPADNSLGFTAAAPNPFAPLGAAASPSSPETAPSGDALRLSRIAHAVPHVEQGTMVGFRLNPRGGPALFEALGFEPGDVVTEINGAALREPGQAPEVFERLAESSQANLVLIRDGSPRVLTVDTSVVQTPEHVP